MFKKTILIIVIIAVMSALGYYSYFKVFNNQYELTYEIQKSRDREPYSRNYKFIAQNDSIASEKAVEWLLNQFILDNPELEKSNYRYQYKHLRLNNITKDECIRVPVNLIRKTFLNDELNEYAKFDERDVDWLMLTDTIPYFNYDLSVWLENPYEEKHLRFSADNDNVAINIAIDTVAYYISHYWYNTNRPIDDILVLNNQTLNFVHTLESKIPYRIANSSYCKGLNLRRYPVRCSGLIDE